MWSLGAIAYILLGGYPPFGAFSDDQKELFQAIKKADYEFHDAYLGEVSEDPKKLISRSVDSGPAEAIYGRRGLGKPLD
jgi:serine/threonine protein kinase